MKPRISKSTSKTYFGLGDWVAGAPLRSRPFTLTVIGQGPGTLEPRPMNMLLATAAFVTLLASDALAQSRWRSAYRSDGLWWGAGPGICTGIFLRSAIALPN